MDCLENLPARKKISKTMSSVSPPVNDTIIIGAGWTGLACAVELCRQGQQVNVLEASSSVGGRARTVLAKDMHIDNGQHLLLGAYQSFLSLLPVLSINEADVLIRQRLKLTVQSLSGNRFQIKSSYLPGKIGQLWSLIQTSGLSLSEKWQLGLFFSRQNRTQFTLNKDSSVIEYLIAQQQSKHIIDMFWSPLCVAALNTQPAIASARVFLRVLQATFAGSQHHSDLLFPRVKLGELFPEPAMNYLNTNHQQVLLNTRVKSLTKNNTGWLLRTNKQEFHSRHVVIATSFQHASKLLSTLPDTKNFTDQINQLTTEPITTVYMQFPAEYQMGDYMTGLSDGISQWFIDRRSCGQAGLIAAVISANGPHHSLDKATLISQVTNEFSRLFPSWPAPLNCYLLREQQATFSCHTDIDKMRPSCSQLDDSLWVTGDYIDNGLPATLESAVQNGVQCAREIIHQR